PPAAPRSVLEAGRTVHRRSAPRGAGLVQRVRQGHDAEADHRLVAPHRRDGRDVVAAPAGRTTTAGPPSFVTAINNEIWGAGISYCHAISFMAWGRSGV